MSTKLTKKQKKAAAFRKRGGKGLDNVLDVPIMDDPEADDGFGINPEAASIPTEPVKPIQSKKRKREDDNVDEPVVAKKKIKSSTEEPEEPKAKKQKAAPKYILFVGNLSYKTTEDAIAAHFSSCDPPPTIRPLTTRTKTPNGEARERFKGCAFLEFSKAAGLQTALRLHHSELDGRVINVELSAGGGGKSEARMKKLKAKNSKLEKHRVESSNRRSKPMNENLEDGTSRPSAKLRHSSTSGAKVRPQARKTWTVPNEGEVAGRGGQKHRRPGNGRRRPDKPGRADAGWTMSGANAIPVG